MEQICFIRKKTIQGGVNKNISKNSVIQDTFFWIGYNESKGKGLYINVYILIHSMFTVKTMHQKWIAIATRLKFGLSVVIKQVDITFCYKP